MSFQDFLDAHEGRGRPPARADHEGRGQAYTPPPSQGVGVHECPQCRGKGEMKGIGCGEGGCRPVTMSCELCTGTGRISEEKLEWVARGETMRQKRVFGRVYRSLSTEAESRGISVVTLSKMESGIIEPDK